MRLEKGVLVVDGLVEHPLRLGQRDVAQFPERVLRLSDLVPGQDGEAVRVGALLLKAEPKAEADHVTVHSTDMVFAATTTLAEIRERGLIMDSVHGRPLPEEKGGPFRLLIPGSSSPCGNVKWVGRLEVRRGPGKDTVPRGPH